MRFYAAVNSYATETSIGFANTWSVLVFDSKSNRDTYVRSATDLATRAITRAEIPNYIRAPKPFSGEFRGIDRFDAECYPAEYTPPPAGLIGEVGIFDEVTMYISRLN